MSDLRQSHDDDERPMPGSPHTDWLLARGAGGRFLAAVEHKQRVRRRRRQFWALACSVAMFAGAALFWPRAADNPGSVVAHAPVLFAPRTEKLPDGSTVELNGAATIAVQFSGPFRRVLLTNGQAHFQVAKDLARPFIVEAGGVEFRAVGTAFLVALGMQKVELLVTEGVVAVERPDATETSRAEPFKVIAGQKTEVEFQRSPTALAAQPVENAEMKARLSWRVPRVEFSGTPLSEVVRTIGKAAGVTIQFSDPEMAQLEMSGLVRADDVDALLTTLEAEFRIRPVRTGNRILLTR